MAARKTARESRSRRRHTPTRELVLLISGPKWEHRHMEVLRDSRYLCITWDRVQKEARMSRSGHHMYRVVALLYG